MIEKQDMEESELQKKNVIWNILGSFVYAFASMLLSFVAIHLAGEERGGIFSFGFSTLGQQLFLVAYFGIRPFQITDGRGEYSFGAYREHRNVTCLIALAAGSIFLMARHWAFKQGQGDYNGDKTMILLLLVIYKVIDGYADVYESEFQRQGRLYLTGKSNFFRTLLSVTVFVLTLALFGNLTFSCMAAVAAQAVGVIGLNMKVIRELPGVDWQVKAGDCIRLFRSTAFLFLSVFLDFYIFSAAKYAIDRRMSNTASGYFNLIFMPTSVIYLVANFVIRPYLTRLTDCWNAGELKEFSGTLLKIGRVIAALTAVAVAGTLLLGRPVLSIMEILMGGDKGVLTVYQSSFVIIVLGGGFYAMANLMYYALVIMRRNGTILGIYGTAAAAAWILSGALVSKAGILGAALCYVILMAGLMIGFGICTAGLYQREKKEQIKDGGNEQKQSRE